MYVRQCDIDPIFCIPSSFVVLLQSDISQKKNIYIFLDFQWMIEKNVRLKSTIMYGINNVGFLLICLLFHVILRIV